MRAALHQVFVAGKPMSYEVEATGAEEDDTVWYVSRWSPIERDGEVVAGLVVASDITRRVMLERLDITERQAAEEKLDEASRRQDVILDSAAEGILGLDDEGCVTFANAAAADLLGARPEDLRGLNIHDVVHAEEQGSRAHAADECPVLLSIRHGIVQHMEDDVFWRSDGIELPRHVHVVADRRARRADRRRAHVQRRHRAQAVRGAAPVPGRPRPGHRPVQPAPLRAGARAPPLLRRALRDGRRRARDRPRQLQVRERHARPQGGRRGDHARRAHHPRADPRDRHVRAPGR